MKAISLRFSDDTHRLITTEARAEGVSTSSFIREAALMRAVWLQVRRDAYDTDVVDDIYERIRLLLDAEDGRRKRG